MQGKQIGEVFNYLEKINVVGIVLFDNLRLGNMIRIVGGDIDIEHVVDSMQLNHEFVESAKKGDRVGIEIFEKIPKGAKVYRV